ncbi:RNA-binding cell elongation regulator Jag/EloR [Paenibacillus physcomitrellae]|uniref:RNA-binding protein KhpB n=1 Tax=Paenibacillus physcomitrellae TaxID=1619311 RepID=A0ABQ1GNJ6_9BACL|nr:RNA-binding cell elongation regulator Jag/EloR [Paenibacillus physcomitrellae]GGA47338.1 DNA-binding protein [Paenibacillus physcomitrellae]
MNKVVTSGKTIEDAVKQGLAMLGVAEDQVAVTVLEQPSRGFLGLIGVKPAKVAVSLLTEERPESESPQEELPSESLPPETSTVQAGEQDRDPYEAAASFLREVGESMGLELEVEIKKHRDGMLLAVSGSNLGLLIGRRGQTLDALQYLANIVANRYSTNFVRLIVDAENFRQRRKKTLEELAERLAERVVRTGKEVVLEPMPSQERKAIHAKLQNHPEVKTLSKGDEPNRRVVITPRYK